MKTTKINHSGERSRAAYQVYLVHDLDLVVFPRASAPVERPIGVERIHAMNTIERLRIDCEPGIIAAIVVTTGRISDTSAGFGRIESVEVPISSA